MSNTRTLRAALTLAAALAAMPALAQTSSAPSGSMGSGSMGSGSMGSRSLAAPESPNAAVGQREVTSTGATVPNPGTDKAGPETTRERKAQERSDRVTRSICNGC